MRKLVLLLCSILAENVKRRSMTFSSSGPQPWSWLPELHWWTSPAQEQDSHITGASASRGMGCSTSPATPALTFCSVHQQKHSWEMLHTWHETHSRGKGAAPQDEPDTQVQHQQLLHRGSPGPLLFLWQMKSSLVPYKPLPRSPEHKGDKNDRAALGEEDSEKPHTAKGSWALLCGRGNTAQTQQTTPSLTTLSPDFGRRGLSSL